MVAQAEASWDKCNHIWFEFRQTNSCSKAYLVSNVYYLLLELFSIECRKTKTKVITLANRNRRKRRNEPIRTPSKYM